LDDTWRNRFPGFSHTGNGRPSISFWIVIFNFEILFAQL
jgi:hypothetical protein